jgi:hypothetical protein
MTISDLAAIADVVAALAVVVTLIFLARQVKQANLLARFQARQRMAEQAQHELYQWMEHPDLRDAFLRKTRLTARTQGKLHFFLLAAMRQREWEWLLHRDGIIKGDVHDAYREVIALHLGIPRTRKWWKTVGRVGFDPGFIAEVDAFLADKPLLDYFEEVNRFDDDEETKSKT